MNSSNLLGSIKDAITILGESINLFENGHDVFYKGAAVQLRILLCDSTRQHDQIVDISLLTRLSPPPLIFAIDTEQQIDIESWLNQTVSTATSTLTVRKLIRLVCDQDGGAHSNPNQASALPPDRALSIIHLAKRVLASPDLVNILREK